MNISELVGDKLPEIKNLLFGAEETEATEETVEAAFLDAKLVDGTIVRIEPAVEVGAVVKVIDEEANELDAPDGDHEMEDGTIIRTEGAVVVEVMAPEVEEEAPEAEAEEVEEEMASEESTEEEDVDVDVKMAAIAADVVAAEKFASTEAVEAINTRFDDMEKAIGMITDIVEKMAAKPSVEPTKKVDNPFSKATTDADLVEKMKKALKK